jgi:hypothetical protein
MCCPAYRSTLRAATNPKIEALATEAVLEYDKIAHELEEVNNKRMGKEHVRDGLATPVQDASELEHLISRPLN